MTPSEPDRSDLVAELFLRALGAVYACAFLSLWVQVGGLIGASGIAPAADLLALARERLGAGAPLVLPTLLWITGASDWALHALCALGVAAASLLVLGRARFAAALVSWLAYLSLTNAGDVFLNFQWDALLLESGVVGLFVASAEPRLGVWLARALLFKLMLLSGLVKLLSGDPTWRDLTALSYHFWTQPLPLAMAFFAAELPLWAQKGATFATLAIELGAPLGIFAPRRVRLASGALLAALQLLIAATGNYGFFNLLSLVLCASLLDDRDLRRLAWLARSSRGPERRAVAWRAAAALLLCASAVVALRRVTPRPYFPRALAALVAPLDPLRSVNAYGLFAVMTRVRPEIRVEGSADGVEWRQYEFRWKPGPLGRAPGFAGPHMPRLDWQMWFAALSSCGEEPWFQAFLKRLLEGSPAVERLLERDPFAGAPPRYLRTTVFAYRFASLSEWRDGAWWVRERVGPYCPVVTLREGRLSVAEP